MIPAEGGPAPSGGRLADNIAYFARALRKAGVPVGPAQVIDAIRAVELIGIGPREDFYWTLHGIFIRRHEHSELFEQAFDLFWRKRNLIEKMMAVAALSGMLRALMYATVPTSGTRFGGMLSRPSRTLRNTTASSTKIIPMALSRLLMRS